MGAIQFLSSLPALLALTGFVIYFFILRNRRGDQITLDIVGKLRQASPERLPADLDKIDSQSLSQLIEGDAALRSKVSQQDFHLLRDALRQQFIISIIVYSLCGLAFIAGIGLYAYVSLRPIPLSISSISAESASPSSEGIPVDLDDLRVRWSAVGSPEDIAVALEELDSHRRTPAKTVRSNEGQVVFLADEYHGILTNRQLGGQNRMRAVFQAQQSAFVSNEFSMRVGTTILAVHIEPLRIKIVGVIDNEAVVNYNFEAKLLVWVRAPNQEPAPVIYGGTIQYGRNDFSLDPALQYDWNTVKLTFLGPDDRRVVRTQLLGF